MAVRQKAVAALPTLMRALRKEAPKTAALPSLRRAFSLYDQINLIDNVPEDQLRFQHFDDTGFNVNGVRYDGSLLCVGNLLMSWTPKKFSEVTTERYMQPINPELRSFIRSTGMKLEAVDSATDRLMAFRNAASTYNILNEEGRIVAAALIPYGVTD
ncbi:hypothetical protein ACJIZ3_007742 [Penstemon smallii]|uniref:Uncharacterized protein n=1 Tax=Penstemon smallii TaxID=265156 RepID=A0ABD3T8Q2_9LAMI